MRFYLAPLEGITGYIYRNAYHTFFKPADKYFTPFIVPNQKGEFRSKERKDILPEHNKGMFTVPQILTNKSADFIRTAQQLAEYGYEEVNLNLGCPSQTVVPKGKGAGFLAKPEELDRFLEEIFDGLSMRISVKTRIGKDNPEEFEELLRIYNRYPMEELIVHPRVQLDFYKNTPNWDVFAEAEVKSRNPLCYNGDIFSTEDYRRWREQFPNISSVMLGRGVLANPLLIEQLLTEEKRTGEPAERTGTDKVRVRSFVDKVFMDYQEVTSGEKNVLFKMKELWFYLGDLFTDSAPYIKKIRKAQNFHAYLEAVDALFEEQEIRCGNS